MKQEALEVFSVTRVKPMITTRAKPWCVPATICKTGQADRLASFDHKWLQHPRGRRGCRHHGFDLTVMGLRRV